MMVVEGGRVEGLGEIGGDGLCAKTVKGRALEAFT